MNILIINWRSLKDPTAGGAEQVTFEHAKRWVKNNNAKVIWISPKYDSKISTETIEGVEFKYVSMPLGLSAIRLLFTFPIYFLAVFFNIVFKYGHWADVIIEGIHGVPMLVNFYTKKPLILYVQEVAGDIWDKMWKFPVNKIGKFLEKWLLLSYRRAQFVVGSQSAKDDLIKVGVAAKRVEVVNHGVQIAPVHQVPQKYPQFTLLFLNRVVKMKGPERALQVFVLVKKQIPDARFLVVGKNHPDYLLQLKQLCKDLGIADSVEFLGFVSYEKKVELLQKSHVLINSSYKEGWGLCNIEANTQGTPAVAFDVEGNRDSIKNEINGFLVKDADLDKMAEIIVNLQNNTKIRENALEYSKKFSWENKAAQFYKIIERSNNVASKSAKTTVQEKNL